MPARAALATATTATIAFFAAGCGGGDGAKEPTQAEPTTLSIEADIGPKLPKAMGPTDQVRIAGVIVGTVTGVTRGPSSAIVRMRIRIRPAWPPEAGVWPPRQDAVLKVRPRIFKAGDYFIDLTPGRSYKAPELHDGDRLPASQTSIPRSILTRFPPGTDPRDFLPRGP